VPECEILRSTTAVRAVVRQGPFFKLPMLMDTGARTGQWTLPRYREWLQARTTWVHPAAPRGSTAGTASAGAAPPAPAPPPGAPEPPRDDVIVIEPPRGKISDILSELD
jgi:hypothetical protein